MDNNDVHPEKALSSILVTRSGIRMEDKEEQLLNAYAPIDVTELGYDKHTGEWQRLE